MFYFEFNKDKWFKYILLMLLGVYFLGAVLNPSIADAAFLVMFVLGVSTIGINRKNTHIYQSEWLLLVLFASYGVISILSFLIVESGEAARHRLEDDGKFLLLIPLYFLLRRHQIRSSYIVYALAVIVCILGLSSMAQMYSVHPEFKATTRPSALVNPMRYAAFSLILSISVIAYLFFKKSSLFERLASSLAFVLGLVACVLTQTRGVWLSLPILLALALWFYFKHSHKIASVTLLLFGLLLLLSASQFDVVKQRINVTSANLERYLGGDSQSSLGTRLDMYKVCGSLFSDSPFYGNGLNAYMTKTHELWKSGELNGMSNELSFRRTPHNEFLMAAVEKGVIGIIFAIAMFAVPFAIFYRAFWHGNQNARWYGACGLTMVIVLFVAAQTGTIFNHNVFTHFYIIWVFLFVSQIRQESPEVLDWPKKKDVA
ncbi:hypothetical protein NBRC116188_05480 [Oceaniserpentilla sp. 4NH20-0058]|uniref:O-antigen ligase family protein n=1 Tax=Oceaniserpentilla sp. 4NH20-0058 TaxID=3127660 RepID=UPI003108CBE1